MFGAPVQVTECRTAEEVINQAALARERRRQFFSVPVIRTVPIRDLTPEPIPIVIALPSPRLLTPREIMKVMVKMVCADEKVRMADIFSPRRDQAIVFPRHICMFIACEHTIWSLPQIGRFFGGRDHTTIIHGRNKIRKMIETDLDFCERIAFYRYKIMQREPLIWPI